jgi:hypothetical protein
VARLNDTLQGYEQMLAQEPKDSLEAAHIEQLITTLRSQLTQYRSAKGTRRSRERQAAVQRQRQDRRKKALNDIFHFYTKQHVTATIRKTFEGVDRELNQLTLGYFGKLLKDFGISLSKKV